MPDACTHCEDLREEIAYLKSELGLQRDAEICWTLHNSIRTSAHKGRPQIAQVIAALYATKGRPISMWRLLEMIPARGGTDDRNPGIVNVWIHRAREILGKDAIETVRGLGFRLTPKGLAMVGKILGRQVAA